MSQSFIHLHVHTEYSLVDSVIRINQLVDAVVQADMFAVAITDFNNIFATVKFYQAALARGIKPIIGCDILLPNPQHTEQPFHLTVLCRNNAGYRALRCLISQAYVTEQKIPMVQREWLEQSSDGLIILSGGIRGDIGQALLAGKHAQAKMLAETWLSLFPDRFYLELVRTGRDDEERYIQLALALAQEMNIAVVASNDICFLQAQDYESHEVRVCIRESCLLSDPRRSRNYSEQQYLRSTQEMQALFNDIPTAITNSVEIAKRCNVQLQLGDSHLPDFPLPPGITVADQLAGQAQAGFKQRFMNMAVKASLSEAVYEQRLQQELAVINRMGYAGYFLIVADFIRWAKENGVPVGPGRGSGAGSLISYALGITDLDPLQYDLLFERFLNPERVSMPDFDIDFCIEGRDRVIDYVTEKYGQDCVAQIITFGSMAARAVVRDVGRVLGHPYGFVDKLAKMIPFELGITLDKALAQEEDLRARYQQEEEVKLLIDLARKLEGLKRNVGKHAGGVVIAPSLLTDFTALYRESSSDSLITQFDKDDIETVGLVKFDFLGLRNLTIIHAALTTVNQQRQQTGLAPICIEEIPTDDEITFTLLKACRATALFQLESRGMKDLIRRLQPDCFEDIVALVALFRPGPLQSGMVDDFIDRKHGRAKVAYFHPALEAILSPTYGVILYQEQVMQIAQVLAGYTLGSADLLRRAMGKKKPEEMAQQRAIFTEGAVKKGVDETIAHTIFDLMEKFAGYGFNKSHSAAYALITYQTAWLKAHYPAAFMVAVLSSDLDNTDKVVTMIEECRSLEITVLPPDVNDSQYRFTVKDQQTINYGLGAIKGVGEPAIVALVCARDEQGQFKNLYDLCRRVELSRLNRRALTALIKSGALDSLGQERAILMASLDKALKAAEQNAALQRSGQGDLFAPAPGGNATREYDYVDVPPWSDLQRLQGEKETLGWYVSGHPLDHKREELSHFLTGTIAALKLNRSQNILVAGSLVAIRNMYNKRGERMAFITLDDGSGRLELTVFSDCHQAHRELLTIDQLVVVKAEVNIDGAGGGVRVNAQQLMTIDQARSVYGKYLRIKLKASQVRSDLLTQLAQVLSDNCGRDCGVCIDYQQDEANTVLQLGAGWRVNPSDVLLQSLAALLGEDKVEMVY